MKISKVQAQLSSYDLLSIINEFLKVEGLVLEEINQELNEYDVCPFGLCFGHDCDNA